MVNVVVTTAVTLSKGHLEKIEKAVTKKYGKDVNVETVVDPSIIGGIQIRIGSRQLDGSVKNKLQQLKNTLSRVA